MSARRQVGVAGDLAGDLAEDLVEDRVEDQVEDLVEDRAEDQVEDRAECLHLLLPDHSLPLLDQTYRRRIFCNHREM